MQGLGDVEVHAVELGDRPVDELLVPLPELVDALDRALGVAIEVLDHGRDRLAGQDALADELHLVLDAVQLFDAPRVGLVEVEVDAVERGGEQLVPIAADRIVRVGLRRVLVAQVRAAARAYAAVAVSAAAASARSSGRRSARFVKYGALPPHASACCAHASA